MSTQTAPLELTDDTFEDEVLQADRPVLIDFWAPWCGPCRVVSPVVEEIAEEYADRVKVGKINVDENSEMAQRYGVRGIPTLLYFKDGEVADRVVGAVPKPQLVEKLEALLD